MQLQAITRELCRPRGTFWYDCQQLFHLCDIEENFQFYLSASFVFVCLLLRFIKKARLLYNLEEGEI